MPDRRSIDMGPPGGVERRTGEDRRKGPKDRRQYKKYERRGVSISTLVSTIAAVAALLGYIYSQGVNDASVDSKLDRNCRILAVVQADSRFLIIEHATNKSDKDAFRQIFTKAFTDACG